MKSDELPPLFHNSPPNVDYHVGQVASWSESDGTNVITVLGSDIVNLPMLNIGDTTTLKAGDSVMILVLKNTYFIVGRVVYPSTDGAFGSSSVDFNTATDFTDTFGWTNVLTTRAAWVFNRPAWANEALVQSSAHFTGRNGSGTLSSILGRVQYEIGGLFANGRQMRHDVGVGALGTVAATYNQYLLLTNPAWTTVTVRAQGLVNLGSGWPSHADNQCTLNTSIIWRKRV